jgi:SAM-dependent methyltransferase
VGKPERRLFKGILKKKKDQAPGDGAGEAVPGITTDELSDVEFVEEVYRQLLGREADELGKAHQLKYLRECRSRLALILGIVKSEEFINKVIRENMPLPSIREERPERYRLTQDIHGKPAWVFEAREAGDFDWLEGRIVENGYYEKPGVWSFIISEDKQLLAEMSAQFRPRLVLDVGCANGPVMKCLLDLGIASEGVDISRLALAKAFPEVRRNIHLGDLLDLDPRKRFDFIFGLDIFEHLNPNKLPRYISRVEGLLEEGGYLFGNIPAFGEDEVFGTVFEVYLKEWEADIRAGRLFSAVHTDAAGYPVNGHIIGAGSNWWVGQFEQHGLLREVDIEKALHEKYDESISKMNVSRRAFFIFSKGVKTADRQGLLERLGR